MIVMGISIPQSAVDAGVAAMKGEFELDDVREAVGTVLYDMYYDGVDHSKFDYGVVEKHVMHDRIADRLLQSARKAGGVTKATGRRWKAQG